MSEENKNIEPEQQTENVPEEITPLPEIFLPGTEEQPFTQSNPLVCHNIADSYFPSYVIGVPQKDKQYF